MGSFKRDGQNQKPNRRRGINGPRRRGDVLGIESLESRTLLSGWKPTNNNLADAQNGPMANEGQTLVDLYQSFLKTTGSISSLESQTQFDLLQFKGNSVFLDVKVTGTFSTAVTSLKDLGMQVTTTGGGYDLVDGWLPISELPALAELPQTSSVDPIYKPVLSTYQGIADNQGLMAMQADVAQTTFGVTGKGVTVGVISASVNEVGNGLADSVKTGDLPPNVKVIQDDPNGPGTDEGRAMLENIYDMAPGAALQFATGDTGELGFQQNIVALANAGSNLISDDLRYLDEPAFQDGSSPRALTR